MQEFTIHLRSVRDVNDFVALTAPLCAVTLTDGFQVVDGKSFMEIFRSEEHTSELQSQR